MARILFSCDLFVSTVAAKCSLGQNAEQRRAPSDLDQSSMLKVICNQRDRFRARLRETEEVYIPLTFSMCTGAETRYSTLSVLLSAVLIAKLTWFQEIRILNEKIGTLTTELEKTKADNVKLYGKIRYVQDYNSEKVVSRGSKKVHSFIHATLYF